MDRPSCFRADGKVFVEEQKAKEGEENEKAKRHDLVIKRFRAKMQNKGLFMCYAGWQAFIARIKWERVTLARFAKKISQRCVVSSLGSWREFVSDRKYVKALLLRVLGRLKNGMLNKAFSPWRAPVGEERPP